MISFDTHITWREEYRRTHRSKYEKRIRCFPDHLNGIHNVFLKRHAIFIGRRLLRADSKN